MENLLSVMLLLLGILPLYLLYPVRKRNPLFLFVLFNTFFSLTISRGLDFSSNADAHHGLILILTSGIAAIYPMFFFNYRRYYADEKKFLLRLRTADLAQSSGAVWVLFFVSVMVSFIYYQFVVGYNLTHLMLYGANVDYATMRLESYAGERYTGAGPVNQFKNTLLPIAFFTITSCYIFSKRYMAASLFLVLFLPFFLWAILGTGQRTFLVLSLVGLVLFFSVTNININKYFALFIGVGFLLIFALQSFALGRTDEISLVATFEQLAHRVSGSNQLSALVGFRYVHSQSTVYGVEWLQILKGFVPGQSGSTLSNDVFAEIFGGSRGTSPVSLWTSVYYNFGTLLTPLAAVLIMKVVEFSHRILSIIKVTSLTLFMYSFLMVYLMFLPVSHPFSIINNGVLGLMLILLVGGLRLKK